MVGRSNDNPHAMTRTFSGSPIGSNISGRNTPEFPTYKSNVSIERQSDHFNELV